MTTRPINYLFSGNKRKYMTTQEFGKSLENAIPKICTLCKGNLFGGGAFLTNNEMVLCFHCEVLKLQDEIKKLKNPL